jgi:hypothetical protein
VVQSVYRTAAGEASVGESETGEWVQSGRAFSAAEIAQIRETVAWLPGLARKELAATVCEHRVLPAIVRARRASTCEDRG